MENLKIKTKVVHSLTKSSWNIINTELGGKFKIARVPYIQIVGDEITNTIEKYEALKHALFISNCFNTSESKVEKRNSFGNDIGGGGV